MNNYQKRDVVLRAMGFDSYNQYLNSELWSDIRQKIIGAHRVCWKCDSLASVVHHRRYDLPTLMGLDLCGLVAVCQDCHEEAEYLYGRKSSMRQANDALNCGEYILCEMCGIIFHSEQFVSSSGLLDRCCRRCSAELDEAIEWTRARREAASKTEPAESPSHPLDSGSNGGTMTTAAGAAEETP